MAAPTLEQIATLAGALGVGGIATKTLEWWLRKRRAERREPADMIRAAAELQGALSKGSTALLNSFRKEFEFLRKRVSELQDDADRAKVSAAEAKSEASLSRSLAEAAQADHARCQAELKELKDKIDVLMAGPVAIYDGSGK